MRRSHLVLLLATTLLAGCAKPTTTAVAPVSPATTKVSSPTESSPRTEAGTSVKLSVSSLNDLALTRIREYFPTEAEALSRQVIATEPTNAAAWFNLGRALLLQQKVPEARDAFAKSAALRAEPNADVAYYQVLVEQGNQEAYAAALAKAWQQFPQDEALKAFENAAKDLAGVHTSETGVLTGIDLDGDGKPETVTWTPSQRFDGKEGPLTVKWGDGRPDSVYGSELILSVAYLPVTGMAPILMVRSPGGTLGDFDGLYTYLPESKQLKQVEKGIGLSYQGNGRFHAGSRSGGLYLSSDQTWTGRGLSKDQNPTMTVRSGEFPLWAWAVLGKQTPLTNAEDFFQSGATYEQCQALLKGSIEVVGDQPAGNVWTVKIGQNAFRVEVNQAQQITSCRVP